MRKFFTTLSCLGLLFAGIALAKDPLRTEESIAIDTGKVVESGILADSNGLLFIEFSQNARIVVSKDRISFSGEIVPPQIIALPDNKPRARMQEVLTFELLGDTAEHLTFADRFDLMSERTRIRYRQLYPESFSRTTSLVQLLLPLHEEYGELALWEYRSDTGWNSVGGKVEETSTEGTTVFSSALTGTGIYTLFDENPSPDFIPPFPLDQMTLVEPDPFAEEYFTENAAYSPEADIQMFEGSYIDPQLPVGQVPLEGEYGNVPLIIENGQQAPFGGVDGGFSALPLNITGGTPSDRTLTPDELYAQKEAQGQIPALPLMFPGTENEIEQELVIELPPLEPVPIPDVLPQTGPEGESKQKTMFPFMIVFAVIILGASFYFAISGRKRRR